MKRTFSFYLILFLVILLILLILTLRHQLHAQTNPPTIYATALCGLNGDQITVRGDGFLPDAHLRVTWSGLRLGTLPRQVQVNPLGQIAFDIIVPYGLPGRYIVQVSDGVQEVSFPFTLGGTCITPPTPTPVIPQPTQTPTPTVTPPLPDILVSQLDCQPIDLYPNQPLTIFGRTFQPGVGLKTVRWDGVQITWQPDDVIIDDQGRFQIQITTPDDDYTLHTLSVTDEAGSQATCYPNLMPRHPTPTHTPTPTITPSPTATWTPGPPTGIVIVPTATLQPTDHCAHIEATFTRQPLEGYPIRAGIVLTNTHQSWLTNRVALGIWQYQFGGETDTEVRATLPPLAVDQQTTLPLNFAASVAGDSWFQVRLIDTQTGQVSPCTSAWQPVFIVEAEPDPPALQAPYNDTWLNDRTLTLAWQPATVPIQGEAVTHYEVELFDLAGVVLRRQIVPASQTTFTTTLDADYGQNQLTWRVRAKNDAGWGLWTKATYFGLDSTKPTIAITFDGDQGLSGWWRSPLVAQVGGVDALPGSGLQATYLQIAEGDWQQTIPGQSKLISHEGRYTLRVYGRDQASNRSAVAVEAVHVDWTPPEALQLVYSAQPNAAGWYTQPLTISLVANDPVSGVATATLQRNNDPPVTTPLLIAGEGQHQLQYRASDHAGNETAIETAPLKLDLTPPTGHLALNGSLCQTCPPANVTVAVADPLSGIAHWTLALSETILATGTSLSETLTLSGNDLPPGLAPLSLTVEDRAGWVHQTQLMINNAPYIAGPTPTPWQMATATPAVWPTATPEPSSYATITPSPTANTTATNVSDTQHPIDNTAPTSQPTAPNAPVVPIPNYPVGDTTVPVILPVTGHYLLSTKRSPQCLTRSRLP